MALTATNPRTCLFCDKRELAVKDLADLYHKGQTDKFEDRQRCENGTDQEKQLYDFMLTYSEDQMFRLRNSQWAPEIISVLKEKRNSTVVFAFGAGHFQGEHRVQRYLEEAGFEIDYMTADDPFM